MRHLVLIGLLALLTMMSCGKRTVKVDRVMKKIIDTTSAPIKVVLRDELDSLCTIRQDSMVAAAVDSILAVRRAEIEKIAKDEN